MYSKLLSHPFSIKLLVTGNISVQFCQCPRRLEAETAISVLFVPQLVIIFDISVEQILTNNQQFNRELVAIPPRIS